MRCTLCGWETVVLVNGETPTGMPAMKPVSWQDEAIQLQTHLLAHIAESIEARWATR